MDPNQNSQQINTNPLDTGITRASPDKKKLLIIIGGVVVFIFVFAAIIFFSQGSTPEGEGPQDKSQTSKNVGGQLPTNVPSAKDAPEGVALGFYNWFVSRPAPLSSGEYKARSDVASEYKIIIADWVAQEPQETRDKIFHCGLESLPTKVESGGVEYDEDKKLALVTLKDPSTGQNQFIFKMGKEATTWRLVDIWCAP